MPKSFWVNKMAKKRKYKPQETKVLIGPTFMVRTICRHCGSGPQYCYYLMNPSVHHDPRVRLKMSDSILSWEHDHLKIGYTKYTKARNTGKISRSSFPLDYMRHRPTLSRSTLKNGFTNFVDIVNCTCMRTSWLFNQIGANGRPEIINRTGRYGYPQKLTE